MNITGTVESKRKDGKAIKVGEHWYSVMFASVLNDVDRGDSVEVDYTTKPSPSGVDYRNIKAVKKIAAPASRPITAAPAATTSSSGARTFPVGAFSPERAIIRQNSLTNAVRLMSEIYGGDFDLDEIADKTIELARKFEAYSAGDLDREIVEGEVKAMLAKERS